MRWGRNFQIMKNSWLDIAEYVSLAGSVVGAAVAVTSQQVVYAAAPMSAALLLNVANRRRLEQQAEQNREGVFIQVQQQLSKEVESLRAYMQGLPNREQFVGLQEAIQSERQRLQHLENSNLAAIELDISKIKEQYAALRESFLQKESQEEKEIVQITEKLAQIEENLQNKASQQDFTSLVSAIAVLEQTVQPSRQTIAALEKQLETLSQQVNRQNVETFQSTILEQLEQIRSTSAALTRRLESIEALELQSIPEALTQLQKEYTLIAETSVSTVSIQKLENEVEKALQGIAELQAELSEKLPPIAADFQRSLMEFSNELQSLSEKVNQLTEETQNRVSKSELEFLTATVAELEKVTSPLIAWEANVREQLDTLNTRFNQQETHLQEQIQAIRNTLAAVGKRIDELPPPAEPVDITGVTEAINKIVETLNEAKTQLENRIASLEALELHSLATNELPRLTQQYNALNSALADITTRLHHLPEASKVDGLERAIIHLQQRIDALPPPPEPVDLTGVTEAIAKIVDAVVEAKTQLENTLNEAKSQLEIRIAQLEEFVNPMRENIPQLQKTLQKVETEEITSIQSTLAQLQADLEKSSATILTAEINQLLKTLQPYEYELIFERQRVREILEKALLSAQERLIIVCPWLSRASLDNKLLEKLEAFLQRHGYIDIGWGLLKDIETGEFPRRINQQWQISNLKNSSLYDALNDIERLRAKYPGFLRLKVLGTHENFIICDNDWALLTTYNFLSAEADFPEREIGIQTNDSRIIQALIARFQASALPPSHPELIRKRGLERLDTGDYLGAIEDYTLILANNPNNAIAYNNRAIARYNLGEYQGAVEDCNRAIQLKPNEAAYYFNRGLARFNLQDYRGAISDFSEVIRLKPADADAYFYRGEAHRLSGNYRQAIADYKEALRYNPNEAVTYNNLGLVYYHLKEYLKAIENYTQALRINPDDIVAYFNRGVAQSAQGEYSHSIEDFSQALQRNPEYAAAYYHRGLARNFLGDKQKAKEDLQKAAELFSAKGETESYNQTLEALHKL